MIFPNSSPAAPEVITKTKTLLNPTHLKMRKKIRFNIRTEDQYADSTEDEMVEVSEQNHGSQQSVIMKLVKNIVRVVLSQLKQSFLADFEELCLNHVRVIVRLRVPTQRVAEYKSDKDEVKECE